MERPQAWRSKKRRVWRKIHIGINEQTLEVRAVEITGSNTGDAPMLPHLLNRIPRDQQIGSVTADGAYDTRRCHKAIAERVAAAEIPPRRNGQPWKPTTAVASPDTTRCARQDIWAVHSGGTEAASNVRSARHSGHSSDAQRTYRFPPLLLIHWLWPDAPPRWPSHLVRCSRGLQNLGLIFD